MEKRRRAMGAEDECVEPTDGAVNPSAGNTPAVCISTRRATYVMVRWKENPFFIRSIPFVPTTDLCVVPLAPAGTALNRARKDTDVLSLWPRRTSRADQAPASPFQQAPVQESHLAVPLQLFAACAPPEAGPGTAGRCRRRRRHRRHGPGDSARGRRAPRPIQHGTQCGRVRPGGGPSPGPRGLPQQRQPALPQDKKGLGDIFRGFCFWECLDGCF